MDLIDALAIVSRLAHERMQQEAALRAQGRCLQSGNDLDLQVAALNLINHTRDELIELRIGELRA